MWRERKIETSGQEGGITTSGRRVQVGGTELSGRERTVLRWEVLSCVGGGGEGRVEVRRGEWERLG